MIMKTFKILFSTRERSWTITEIIDDGHQSSNLFDIMDGFGLKSICFEVVPFAIQLGAY